MKRLFATVIAVLTIAVAGAGSAFAANPTWYPTPDAITPNASLYVSPAMHSRLNMDEQALVQKIQEADGVNGLHYRVVITQQGDDLSEGSKSTWASDALHNVLWNNFQTAGNFDEAHTVILLYIRDKSDNSGSIAARSGSYLHSLNIGQEQFADPNGPVISGARAHIRSDVSAAVVAILSNINDAVTSAKAAAASPAADQSQPATGTPASDDNSGFVTFVVFAGIGVVVLIVVLMVRVSNRRDRERRERLASLSSQARSERPSYTPPSYPSYTPSKHRSSPPPRRSSGGSSGRRSSGGGTNIFLGGGYSGGSHSSGGSRSSCGSSSSGSSSSSSCGSSSSSSSCGSSSSSSCGGSSSSCGGGGSV